MTSSFWSSDPRQSLAESLWKRKKNVWNRDYSALARCQIVCHFYSIRLVIISRREWLLMTLRIFCLLVCVLNAVLSHVRGQWGPFGANRCSYSFPSRRSGEGRSFSWGYNCRGTCVTVQVLHGLGVIFLFLLSYFFVFFFPRNVTSHAGLRTRCLCLTNCYSFPPSGRCSRSDTAMTGEITLRGLVLPVSFISTLFTLHDIGLKMPWI